MTASNIQKYKKENIVVLSNSIIDSSNLPIMEKTEIGEKFISSLDAQRIFYFAINKISQAKREDKESIFDKDIFISVDEIVKATNLTRDRLYTIMKKAAQALQSSFIESYHPGDILKKNFTFTALVTQCKYESEGNAGIYVSLNPKLKDFLIIDSNFTQLSLQSLVRLNTKYSLKLYSYLKSQRDKYSHKNEIEVTLEKLRFLLFTNKIKEYNNYPSLKRSVLSVAIKEINNKTELKISYKEVKLGRKVNSLLFKIEINQNQDFKIEETVETAQIPKVEFVDEGQVLKNKLKITLQEFGCDSLFINYLFKKYATDLDYIEELIKDVLEQDPRDKARYLNKISGISEKKNIFDSKIADQEEQKYREERKTMDEKYRLENENDEDYVMFEQDS